MPADLKSDSEKVLAALEGAARLSRTHIYNKVFQHHRSSSHVDAIGEALEASGRILRMRVDPAGGNERHPTEVWEIISVQNRSLMNGFRPETLDNHPPAGEGWLPRAKTLKRAQRGVVPAVAARHGRKIRKKEGVQRQVVSDETRGAADYIGQAYRSYKKQGVVEVEGDWIRLARNPTRRPPHHWYEALLHFLAEGHPTLDGKWHRKPKRTLVAVMEEALGRKLETSELVRRKPGTSGSWNPEDIVLHDYETITMTTLAEVQARPLQ